MDVIITPDYQQRHPNPPMPVYRDYEITINLNELVEHSIPLCDIRHPDHCLTSEQIDELAHCLRGELDFTPIFNQAYAIIKEYVTKSGTELPSENNNQLDKHLHYK